MPDLARLARVARRGDEQGAPRLLRQRLQPLRERSFDVAANGDRFDDRRRAAELGVGERRDRLVQRQRVPARLHDEAITNPRAHRSSGPGGELGRGIGRKSPELESLDPGRRQPRSVAHRQEEDHALAPQPATGEQERLAGWRVQPVGVVDHGEHRPLLGSGREQADGCRRGGEPVARGRRSEGEGARQHRGLRRGDSVKERQERPQQIGEPGERQLRLCLERSGTQHREPGGSRDGRIEERGLPDPWFAVHDQGRAHAEAGTIKEPADARNLACAAW